MCLTRDWVLPLRTKAVELPSVLYNENKEGCGFQPCMSLITGCFLVCHWELQAWVCFPSYQTPLTQEDASLLYKSLPLVSLSHLFLKLSYSQHLDSFFFKKDIFPFLCFCFNICHMVVCVFHSVNPKYNARCLHCEREKEMVEEMDGGIKGKRKWGRKEWGRKEGLNWPLSLVLHWHPSSSQMVLLPHCHIAWYFPFPYFCSFSNPCLFLMQNICITAFAFIIPLPS